MLSVLAVLGLGLASLGIYGVIARTMAQRTGEFGIRLALGAQAGDITRLVLASGAKLALIGSALGLLGAFGISRLIAAAFPGMQTSSVPVLIGVTAPAHRHRPDRLLHARATRLEDQPHRGAAGGIGDSDAERGRLRFPGPTRRGAC